MDAAFQRVDLAIRAACHCQVGLQRKLQFVQQRQGIGVFALPALCLLAADVGAQIAIDQAAHAQDLGAALPHELVAHAQQFAHRVLLAWVDEARGQDTQAQPVRRVSRVAEAPAVRQTVALLDGGGVDQVHDEACILQAVDQPMPVMGGLQSHAAHRAGIRSKDGDDHLQLVGQVFGNHRPVQLIEHIQDAVVALQVTPRVRFVSAFLVGTIG